MLYAAHANADRVDAYRLGTDGLLPAKPFSSINILNPRRLLVANGVLFIAGRNQVFSVVPGADGSLPSKPTSSSFERTNILAMEMVVANNKLYVALSGANAIEAYPIDANGRIPSAPSSFGVGLTLSDYRALALTGNRLYASARTTAKVDLFVLEANGELPELPENQEPDIFAALPDDIVVRDGILYLTSGTDVDVQAFVLRPNGLLNEEPDAETKGAEFYNDLILDGNLIYAAGFSAGRIDVYALDPVSKLPPEEKAIGETEQDVEAYPSGLTLRDGILYVAQAGHGRIDAFAVDRNGIPPKFPTSSTDRLEDGFPVDTEILELP